MAAINLDVGANTTRAEKDIQKLVNRAYSINLKTKGDAPLGRITGKVNEFNKSLDASNARVIAFGASAGIIFGVERAFSALVSTTIEVQKSLQDINVILNVSTSQLQKFGGELFNIAKNTGQSFQSVAQAATELSRQGLGLEETLRRTNDALILSRLSGLDAAKSVEALTAAVNSYASQAVTASEVVNKFANVDAAFAVSSADLAEALSRVGSSAAQSGVSLNELIGIVTSAQQTTARGGAVIGNSFKTIFTRLQRGKVIDLLENLGINTTNETGQIKSTIQLLQDLANVYDNLGTLQQAEIAEKVGGVFQINILKAALADLGKEFSVYDRAVQIAGSSTDQAVRRNEQLNKTFSAQINILQENAKQLSATAGERLLTPVFDRTVGNLNQLLGAVNESDSQSIGATLGKGILDGLGQILAGPGLALVGGVFIKLFTDLGKFATESIKTLLGLNNSTQQQQNLQQSIQQILSKNPELITLMAKGTQGINKAAEILLATLRAQTVELQKQEQFANILSKKLLGSGVRVKEGVPIAPTPGRTPGRAAGYIPNFVSDKVIEKYTAISLGASSSVRPQMSQGTIDGKKFVMNNQEVEFPGVGKNGDSMVIPLYGGGDKLLTAMGFVPNFAQPSVQPYIDYAKSLQLKVGKKGSTAYQEVVRLANKTQGGKLRSEEEIKKDIDQLAAARKGTIGSVNALKGAGKFAYMYAAQGEENVYSGKVSLTKDSTPVPFSFSSVGLRRPYTFEDDINKDITPVLTDLAAKIIPEGSNLINVPKSDFNEFLDKSAFNQIYGRLFEAVINRAIGKSVKGETGTQRFEFFQKDLSGQYSKALSDIFGSPNLSSFAAGDLKFRAPSPESASVLSFIKKMAAQSGVPYDKTARIAAAGYIPNFSALSDAVSRERAAGVPKNKIYVSQDRRLAAAGYNPLGLGVFNTRDEPNSGARSKAIKSRGYAGGYIPNFAIDQAPADLGSSIAAVAIQLASLTFFLGDFGEKVKQAQQAQIESLTETVSAQKQQLQTIKQTTGESSKAFQKLNKSIAANEAKIASGGGVFGKISARFDALTTALGTLGPTIAATIANAIGRETKGQRVAGTALESAGQAFSFAALGRLFGKKGGGFGLALGGITGAISIFKEASTDLPELQAAADKAAQSLTKFNEASDRVVQSFEKIQELRESGQAEKAAKLQTQLLRDIESFEDPETRQEARAAVINRDQKALTTTLEKGFEENEQASQLQASLLEIPTIIKSVNSIDSKISSLDFFAGLPGAPGFVATEKEKQKLEEKRIQEIDKLFSNLNIFTGKGFEPGKEALGSFTKIQEQLGAGESFEKIFTDLGVDPAVVAALVKNEAQLRESLNEALKRRIALEQLTIQNTQEGNEVIKSINSAFEDLKKNLDNYSKAINEALSNQISGRIGIEESLGKVRTQSLRSRGEIETEFGATRQGRATGVQAELSEINENFNASVRESIGGSLQALIPILGSAFPKIEDLTTIAQPGTEGAQERAEAAILAVQEAITGLGDQFDLSQLQELLGVASLSDVSETGIVDPIQLISQIKEAFKDAGIPEEKFDNLEKALNEQNSTLIQSKRIQEEQKLILAQQKFTENVKLLLTAIKSSFGGFEGFLKNNFTDNIEQIEDSIAGLKTLGTPTGDVGSIEVARDLGILLQELSRLAGASVAPQLEGGADNKVIQAIIKGQGLEIGETIQTTLDSLTGFEGAEDLADAFIKTLQNTLKTTETDPTELGTQIAEIQTTAANEVGKINEQILNGALEDLGVDDPELAEKLKQGLALGFVETEQLLNIQLKTANSYLERIATGIERGIKDAEDAKGEKLTPGAKPEDVPSSAGGSLPKGMRIANDKEFISKNFAKEVRQQSRYGYSGGKPVLLSGFNEKRDAIFNPTMIKNMGMPPNAQAISAGGYLPVIAKTLNFGQVARKDFIRQLSSLGISAKEAIKYEKIFRVGSDLEKARAGLAINQKLALLPEESFLTSKVGGIFERIKNDNKFTGKLAKYRDGGIGQFLKTPGILGKGKVLTRGLGRLAGPITALIEGSRGGLAAARGGEELEAYFDYTQRKFTSSGFSDIGSAASNTVEGLFDPVGLGASIIAGLTESIELAEGDTTQVLLDLFGLGDKRRQEKIDEQNKRTQEQIKRLRELSERGVIFGQRPKESTPTEIPGVKPIPTEIPSVTSNLPDLPEFKFGLEKTKDLKIDDISDINPKKLEEQRKRKQKLIDDNIQLNLLRWSAGTQAQFKQYDKDGNFTGVTELFGPAGRPEKGSRAELNSQLIELNDRIKANRNPDQSLALARQARAIQEKIAGDTTKSQFRGKLFEDRAAQELLKTEGFQGKNVINPNEITRAITDKNGKIIGYARNKSQNLPQELRQNPAVQFSLKQEKLETGLEDQDLYTKKLPELRKIDNPEGIGVFNKQQEGTAKLERQAIQEEERLSRIVKKPNLGKIPNFAQEVSTGNLNIGPINVNLTSSLSSDRAQEYGEEFSAKVQQEVVPLLEKIKEELDTKYGRSNETVTNLLRGNSNAVANAVPPPRNRSTSPA